MADKKFSPMRYSGATEEDAVQGALQLVGASRDEIEVEILDRSEKGVTVRIKPRSAEGALASPSTSDASPAPVVATAPIVEDVPELLAQDEEPDDEDLDDEDLNDESFDDPAPIEAAAPEFDEDAGEESDDLPTAAYGSAAYEEEESEATPAEPPVPIEIDEESAARAVAKAQEFLDKMGLESSVQVGRATEANTVPVVVEGEDVGILIGKHGATLQAFQYLLNLTLNTSAEGVKAPGEGMRVVVDAGNYRARRQSSLEQTARGAAAKARREGRSIRLEPMPAHERRLVHMFLQTESDIQTQSEGREPMRRIVVSPAGVRPSSGRGGFDRPYGGDRENRGMGGYNRRSSGNGGGGNRGFNRGR